MELGIVTSVQPQNNSSASPTKDSMSSKGDFKEVLDSKQAQDSNAAVYKKQSESSPIKNGETTSDLKEELSSDNGINKDKLLSDLDDLMSMLASLFASASNGKNNTININDLKANIQNQISVGSNFTQLSNIGPSSVKDLIALIAGSKTDPSNINASELSKLQQKFQDVINDIITTLNSVDGKAKVMNQSDIMAKVSELIEQSSDKAETPSTTNDSKLITEVKDALNSFLSGEVKEKLEAKNHQDLSVGTVIRNYPKMDDGKSTVKSSEEIASIQQQNNSKVTKSLSKEDKFLSSIISSDSGQKNDKDSLINKAANFVGQFNKVANDDIQVDAGKITVNKATLNEDIIKAIKYMDSNNVKELTVKIAPKELGEMVIRLTMDNGVMKASISASNKEAFNMLNANIQEISNKLTEQNMKIQSFSVGIHNGESFFSNENSKDSNQGRNGSKKISAIDGSSLDGDELDEEIQDDNYVNTLV